MAKSRINRKELRRLKQKQAFSELTQVRLLVQTLPNQAALDSFLLQVEDPNRRRQMYEFCKPFIRFANPQFPSTIQTPGIIIP